MSAKKSLAAIAMAFGMSSAAVGALTSYDLILQVDQVSNSPGCALNLPLTFGCLSTGQVFVGHFSIDSAILLTDGINNTAAISDFYLPFGNLIYSTGPDNTALATFRNQSGFASAPGFLIENGQVVDLVGGLVGSGDVPFIDMHLPGVLPRNRFSAMDASLTTAGGTLRIVTAVPEPETYAMWLLGIAGIALALRPRANATA
ncbi:PEP-CTERM sorting domain-containing protein [Piscinibacter sp. XHJ-5]|uniref:PEP-CTERM sorting domain-containing protein n=1 Tax=Piscinibacter sp. XHJ-5 TaxID=3037797 RepID=UPI0024531D91|nr:PEP-CTERM sorting domain-containing protein [Piscinibacter sp. XHJ-5]